MSSQKAVDHNSHNLVFYIYAPSFRSNSAGVKVLYKFCDQINKQGFQAWVVIHNPRERGDTDPFDCPVLSQETADLHFAQGKKQIIVYSETVPGNPLRATNIVRYFLNFPGVLGGMTKFKSTEHSVAYSKRIAEKLTFDVPVLFIPAVDPSELPSVRQKENINLVYAGKYRAFIGEPSLDYGVETVEIFRSGSNKQTRDEVLNLLSRANRIYVWENSTIATEAILLKTPVIFIQNPLLGKVIAELELGDLGYTFGLSEVEIEGARSELDQAAALYQSMLKAYPKKIKEWLQDAQMYEWLPQRQKIRVPIGKYLINAHRVRLFMGICQNHGLLQAIRVTREFGYLQVKKSGKG